MTWTYQDLPPWMWKQLEEQKRREFGQQISSPDSRRPALMGLLPSPPANKDVFFYEQQRRNLLLLRELEIARHLQNIQMGYYRQHPPPNFNYNFAPVHYLGHPVRQVQNNSKSCWAKNVKCKTTSPPAQPKKGKKRAESPPITASAKCCKDKAPGTLTKSKVPEPERKDSIDVIFAALNLEVAEPQNFLQAYKTKKIPEQVLQSLLPESWSPDCIQNFHHKIIRRKCPVDSPEFQKLNPAFDNSVVEIEKIENPYLWLVFKLKGMETFGDEGQEVRLFHGTEGKRVGPIIKDNFDYRLAGTCRGHRYGKGVNFSFNPNFCKGFAAKGRCVIMARVLMGKIHLGNEHTLLPDPDFHSTGNNHGNLVVKYHDHEFYPEFLIHFNDWTEFYMPWSAMVKVIPL